MLFPVDRLASMDETKTDKKANNLGEKYTDT